MVWTVTRSAVQMPPSVILPASPPQSQSPRRRVWARVQVLTGQLVAGAAKEKKQEDSLRVVCLDEATGLGAEIQGVDPRELSDLQMAA